MAVILSRKKFKKLYLLVIFTFPNTRIQKLSLLTLAIYFKKNLNHSNSMTDKYCKHRLEINQLFKKMQMLRYIKQKT